MNATIPQVKYLGIPCNVLVGRYRNNRTALRLIAAKDCRDVIKGEPVATATINIPEATLRANEIIMQDEVLTTPLTNALQKAGIVGGVKRLVNNFPVCELLIHSARA